MMAQSTRRRLLGAVLPGFALAILALAPPAWAAFPQAFIMGTDREEKTFAGTWFRHIYAEAFKRLGIHAEFVVYPLPRLSLLVDEGQVDGEMLRVRGYGDAHPNLVRVEEAVIEVRLALYAANPELRIARLEDLAPTHLRGEYRRGVGVCESLLKQWLPLAPPSSITSTEQGLRKIVAGRTDLYCDLDLAVADTLNSPELADLGFFRKALDVGAPIPLYPYLHRRHTELAPRLAEVLKKMKAEGLIERYRRDAELESGKPRQ